jgi:hypothetical protein
LDGLIENLAALLLVARRPTLAYLLLVAMKPTLAVLATNSTRVVCLSMEIFNYGCLVKAAFGQTRDNILEYFFEDNIIFEFG